MCRVLTPTDVPGLLERCSKLTLLGWQGVHTQTSSCDVIEIVRGDSAQVLPKRRSEPIILLSFNLRNSATYLLTALRLSFAPMRRIIQIETCELCEAAGAVALRLDARNRTPAEPKPHLRDFISDPTILH